jgi:hypothetical protein
MGYAVFSINQREEANPIAPLVPQRVLVIHKMGI